MKALQIVGFLIILIAGFWIGMQIGEINSPLLPEPASITPQTPVKTVEPVIVPAEPTTPSTPVVVEPAPVETTPTTPTPTTPTTPVTPTPTTATTATSDPLLPNKVSATMNRYENSNFKYGFDIPANLYYSGFAGQDGARHAVGIGKEDPATLADAAIRVYFYGKQIVPELKGATGGKVVDPASKFVYILLSNEYSIKVESGNINHPAVQKIIETLQVY